MKDLVPALLATVVLSASGCSTRPVPRATAHTDYRAQGGADAHKDIRAGKLAIEGAGLPAHWASTFARLLRERYQVEVRSRAGCVVLPETSQHIDGYNKVMQVEITRRFGAGILDRTAEEARRIGPSTYE